MAITDDQLKAITDAEIRSSIAYMGGKLSEQRRRNEYFYLGLPKGELAPPAIEGRSKVVDTSVRDTVEWMLTSLLKIFTAGDKAVEFAPRGPEDEESAKQATDYVNYVFYTGNNGYRILYTAIKDALVQKNGIVKVWWDDSVEEAREDYRGLDAVQLAMLLQDPDVELLEQQVNEEPQADPSGMPQGGSYDVAVKRVLSKGRVCIENVPPEEFLISRKAKSIQDTPFVAHRVEKTIGQLRAAGYKNVDQISTDDSAAGSMNSERIERRSWDDELPYLPNQNDTNYDPSNRIVWLTECYVKADRNGDGISEWLKVVRAGNALLEVEECDGPPFYDFCPIPLPHRFFGLALADLLVQAQITKTALKRSLLDNIYLQAHGRYFAVEGQVNLDDLLTARPGGVVRIKSPGAVGALDQGRGDLGGILNSLEYEETQKENASGWTRYSQGTSADALNKTATGTSIITNRSDARVELMARNMSEGIKAMFLGILKLVSQYQDRAQTIRLNNKWVDIDPRNWKTQFDLIVNVGIGTGSKDAQTQKLMALHQMQLQALQLGYATPKNLFNGAKQVAETMGMKNPEQFFTDPETMPQKPPAPPPEMIKAQAQMQADQARLQFEQQKAQVDVVLTREKMAAEQQVALQKAQIDAQTEVEKERIRAEAAIRQKRIDAVAMKNAATLQGLRGKK